MSTIVIANSVGIDSNDLAIIHSPSRWTNSSQDKSVFAYYPWELAYTSSLLKRMTDHRIIFMDACLEKLDAPRYYERICAYEPDFLLMEPSTRTWADDRRLMERVKQTCGTNLIVAGQHASAFPEAVSRVADFVLIGEYEYTVLDIVSHKPREEIRGLFPNARRPLLDVNTLPWPEDSDVSRLAYGIPGEPSSEYLEIQAYATRGCPFNCAFCVCRHLYYAQPNWRPRAVRNIVDELAYLKHKYPSLEGIFFDEECHNIQKQFVLDLSREIRAHHLDTLKIEAMCVYYTLDEEMMDAMKAAGYYLLRVGIETAGVNAARGIGLGKKFDLERLRRVLRYARSIDLKMYGTFTFGAPGATRADDQATLGLMEEIIGAGLLWRFQTSICTPQPGTPFYEWAVKNRYLDHVSSEKYDGGNFVVMQYPDYPSHEIMAMYTASQRFYDLAMQQRFLRNSSAAVKALCQMNPRKILMLRSSRMPPIEATLEALRQALPHVHIDILGQRAVEKELCVLQRRGLIQNIYYADDGFFEPRKISPELTALLHNGTYDMGILFYNNLKGRGYANVEAVMELISPAQWGALNADGALMLAEEIRRVRNEETRVCSCATDTGGN